jgi:hypothetical protein
MTLIVHRISIVYSEDVGYQILASSRVMNPVFSRISDPGYNIKKEEWEKRKAQMQGKPKSPSSQK